MGNATIKGSVQVGANTFDYAEVKSGNSGGGPRGIHVWLGTRSQFYGINPNPHSNPKYNKGQGDFYKQAASVLGAFYNAHNQKFPRYQKSSFTFNKITYTNDIPH